MKFVFPAPKPLSISDYVKSVGSSILKNAVIYGLSAAFPPLGAVAIPAYMAYNHFKLGQCLYKACNEVISKGKVSGESVEETSARLGEFVTQRSADDMASTIVSMAKQSGLFEEMTKETGVHEVVFAEMLKGSTSSALSTSAGELAKFVVGKVVGA